MSNEGTTIHLPKVSKAVAVVELTLEKMALLKLIGNLAQEKNELQKQIEELEKKLASSVTAEYFSSVVKRMVREGKIPVPNEVLQQGLPVECLCGVEDVIFRYGSVSVRVRFECSGYTVQTTFDFEPIPRGIEQYPEFHMGYRKQGPVTKKKSRSQKPRVPSTSSSS